MVSFFGGYPLSYSGRKFQLEVGLAGVCAVKMLILIGLRLKSSNSWVYGRSGCVVIRGFLLVRVWCFVSFLWCGDGESLPLKWLALNKKGRYGQVRRCDRLLSYYFNYTGLSGTNHHPI